MRAKAAAAPRSRNSRTTGSASKVPGPLLDRKADPCSLLIRAYRNWLDRNRKQSTPLFRAYETVADRIYSLARKPPPKPALLAHARRFHATPADPAAWAEVFHKLDKGIAGSSATQAPPAISILTPAWNTKAHWFCEAAVSVLDQTRTDWEWIVVDDGSTDMAYQAFAETLAAACPRFRFYKLGANVGISEATNALLEFARGQYVCMLDHDDLLHPRAVGECLETLEADGGRLDAVYTDSNKVNERGILDEPFFKPGWSPEYFRGVMYVGHLLCVRREIAIQLCGFDPAFDGVQDFEFFLRYSERTQRIGHIPKVLYHWRRTEGSLAATIDAKGRIGELQQTAVQHHLNRLGLHASAEPGASWPHRVNVVPGPRRSHPLVSIVIPTRDAPEVLATCLDSIRALSTYPNLQVVCADNGTVNEDALRKMREPGIERVDCPGPFNYSKVNNKAIAEAARGEFLLLVNNDIEVLSPDWVERLLFYAEQPDVGAAGALLLYPDRSVQHAGVALGFRGTADHVHRRASPDADGYAGSLACAREVSAVTAACLMVKRSLYDQVGGLNEYYRVLYQDVDFCLRLRGLGKRNIYAPGARLIHHESYTRQTDYNMLDRALMIDCWDELIERDPYFNPNFSREAVDYQVSATADLGAA